MTTGEVLATFIGLVVALTMVVHVLTYWAARRRNEEM